MAEHDFDAPENGFDDEELDWSNAQDIGAGEEKNEPPKLKPLHTPVSAVERVKTPLVIEKDMQTLERAIASANKLTKNLESLDFEMSKFIKFEQKVSSFSIKNALITGVIAFIIGIFSGNLT